MNRYMEEKWAWIEGTHGMRTGLLDSLTDADLRFSPGGHNMTLGELCRECGEIEHSYIQSLKTFAQNWEYRNDEPGLDGSVERLKAWYAALDAELKETVAAFKDDELGKMVERPGGWSMPVETQLDVYLQALLIFFGKAVVYLKAMEKEIPEGIQMTIG